MDIMSISHIAHYVHQKRMKTLSKSDFMDRRRERCGDIWYGYTSALLRCRRPPVVVFHFISPFTLWFFLFCLDCCTVLTTSCNATIALSSSSFTAPANMWLTPVVIVFSLFFSSYWCIPPHSCHDPDVGGMFKRQKEFLHMCCIPITNIIPHFKSIPNI